MTAHYLRRFRVAALVGIAAGSLQAASPLSGSSLAQELKAGGYVILMRHASSPTMPPDKASAQPDNIAVERELDEAGRQSARLMGEALKTMRLPVGAVLSSPTYRALQTVRLASLGNAQTFPELGDGGQSMQAAGQTAGAWLRSKVAERPRAGTDTMIVTHLPNITAAIGKSASDVKDGESLVFRPDGKGGTELLGRIRIEEWPLLASR
jgi:phosphohistidine phosphatase SixA